MGGCRFYGALMGNTFYFCVAIFQQCIGALLDCRSRFFFSRTAHGRVVFDASVLGRIVGGGDDNAVGEMFLAVLIIFKNGPGNDGRWRYIVVLL